MAVEFQSILIPVRDGLAYLEGGGRTVGLRYYFDFNPYPMDSNLTQLYDRYLNSQYQDPIHLGITFRFPNVGRVKVEMLDPGDVDRRIMFLVIVGGIPLANTFCQESSHILGLGNYQSSHHDGDSHSKDQLIDGRDAGLGFDIQYNTPFQLPIYDVMFPYIVPANTLKISLSFNSWDLEFLRQSVIAEA